MSSSNNSCSPYGILTPPGEFRCAVATASPLGPSYNTTVILQSCCPADAPVMLYGEGDAYDCYAYCNYNDSQSALAGYQCLQNHMQAMNRSLGATLCIWDPHSNGVPGPRGVLGDGGIVSTGRLLVFGLLVAGALVV